jgi:hypothetical protein
LSARPRAVAVAPRRMKTIENPMTNSREWSIARRRRLLISSMVNPVMNPR